MNEMELYSELLQTLEMKVKDAENKKLNAENERDKAINDVKEIRQRYINIMGEKTSEVALDTAVHATAKECGFYLVDSTVYPDIDNSRYIFLIEAECFPKNFDLEKARNVLEKELAKANPSMADKIKRGLCSPTVLKLLPPGAFKSYMEFMHMKGNCSSQIKPVSVISNEVQRKFFFDLIEKE